VHPTRLTVVNHTHWDREWYYTFQVFRNRLVRVLEQVLDLLDHGAIRHFMLDGQAIVLEDLAEVASPVLLGRLRRRIEAGAISVGPWYVLADELLVSGESLVRNLQAGHAVASRWGPVAAVGYAPDTFSHPSQLPQILARSGIGTAVASRGLAAEPCELWWEAPDGTRVLLLSLPQTYYQQPVLDQEGYVGAVQQYLSDMAPHSLTGEVLLLNGGDHLAPIVDLAARLERVRAENPAVAVVEEPLAEYVGRVRTAAGAGTFPVVKGEQRAVVRPWVFILQGVLSTRTYLKQWNDRLEDRLTGYLEPLAVLSWLRGGPDRQAYLEHCWRSLLKNQPHDSICGCSIDSVHREMVGRYEQLQREADALQAELTEQLWPLAPEQARDYTWERAETNPEHTPGTLLHMYNPLPVRRGATVAEVTMRTPRGHTPRLSVPFELLERRDEVSMYSPLRGVPGRPEHSVWRLRAQVDALPGTGWATLPLAWDEAAAGDPLPVTRTRMITTAEYVVQVEADGTLTVTDKRSGQKWAGLGALSATLDAGDTYNYSPPEHDCCSVAALAAGSVEARLGRLGAELRYTLLLDQPAGLNPERTGPSAGRVTSTYRVTVSLHEGDPVIHLTVEGENRACDQRLRLRAPLGGAVPAVWADSHYDLIRRPAVPAPAYVPPAKGMEHPVTTFTADSFSWAEGLAVLHEGLHEHELENGDTLAVTLLRSVGWLGRHDLRYRNGGAGPALETPDAQCLGPQRFRLGLVVGEPVEALPTLARSFRLPPLAVQVHGADTPPGLLEVDGAVQVTAMKPAAGEPGAIAIRAYNPGDLPVDAVYHFGWPVRQVADADLLERREGGQADLSQGAPEGPGQALHLHFGPKEIRTILVYPVLS
jgi:mannosylglycerate hydrolase